MCFWLFGFPAVFLIVERLLFDLVDPKDRKAQAAEHESGFLPFT